MIPSWAITLLIVVGGAGFLIMVAVIFAINSRRPHPTLPLLAGPTHQSAPAHQGAPIQIQSAPVHQSVPAHHQSAPAHQDASEGSASVDSELAAQIHEALSGISQGPDNDIELGTRDQAQGAITPASQSASEDIEASTPTQTQDVVPSIEQT